VTLLGNALRKLATELARISEVRCPTCARWIKADLAHLNADGASGHAPTCALEDIARRATALADEIDAPRTTP